MYVMCVVVVVMVMVATLDCASGGGDVSSSCGSCKMREELKHRNLEAIKGEVLRRMGFQTAPNITGRVLPHVPAHILAKVDGMSSSGGGGSMQSDEPPLSFAPAFDAAAVHEDDEDDFHVRAETVLTFAQPYHRLRHTWRNHDVLRFQFADAIARYAVHNATLYVYVKGAPLAPATPTASAPPFVHLELYRVQQQQQQQPTASFTLVKVGSRKMAQPRGHPDWLRIDATPLVADWLKRPRDNHGFVVTATVNGKRVLVNATAPSTVARTNNVPFVEIVTHEPRRRMRRSISLECNDNSNQSLCCRYPLTVNFESFGWDFVVAPKSYEANYCSGDCPPLTLQKQPHTHLLHMASPGRNGGTCCAPRKLSSISMLYFDPDMNIVYGTLPGMVVDRCGCT